jgi:excisionase family DNA binding protein
MTISTPVRPTGEQAKEAQECLESLKENHSSPTVTVKLEGGAEFEVPEFAFRFLFQLLQETAKGNAVTLIPVHSELTTLQAADILNVSRPYVVKLLESGEIPFHKRGRHRRIRFDDLMEYKKKDELEREKAFEEMVELSEELGIGYE